MSSFVTNQVQYRIMFCNKSSFVKIKFCNKSSFLKSFVTLVTVRNFSILTLFQNVLYDIALAIAIYKLKLGGGGGLFVQLNVDRPTHRKQIYQNACPFYTRKKSVRFFSDFSADARSITAIAEKRTRKIAGTRSSKFVFYGPTNRKRYLEWFTKIYLL